MSEVTIGKHSQTSSIQCGQGQTAIGVSVTPKFQVGEKVEYVVYLAIHHGVIQSREFCRFAWWYEMDGEPHLLCHESNIIGLFRATDSGRAGTDLRT